MKKTLTIILTAALVIGIALASCESTTGSGEPPETTNEQGEGLEATVNAVASFFELDSTDRRPTDVDVAIFLKLGDIPGESIDEEHEKWIDILGVELGRTVKVIPAFNDREAGQAAYNDLSFTKWVDKSSPLLEKAAASDEVFPAATLSIHKARTDVQVENITITMQDVIVTSYQKGGLEETLTEEITFSYRKVRYHFENGWP